MTGSTLTFDYTGFITQIPLYSNPSIYPSSLLQNFWNAAINYMSDNGSFGIIQGTQRQFCLNLLTAHLVFLNNLINEGQVPGLMQNATVDKVSVGLTPPPIPNQWQWWLNQSPFGQQLLALLQANTVGGSYISGPYGGIRGYNPNYGFGYGGSL